MKKYKKIVITSLSVIVMVMLGYLYLDWDMIKLKRGAATPILWKSSQFGENPIQLTDKNQRLSNPDVNITFLYYLPESREIHLGVWYRKWQYRSDTIPFNVLDVTFRDDQGKVYDHQTYSKQSGILDEFQFRSVEGIDLTHLDSLELVISLVKKEGERVTLIETSQVTIPLDKLEMTDRRITSLLLV